MCKKVSIITPCYNGEEFIARFLESILNQTYKNIELIVIDDGSTDNTKSIIYSYKNKFNDKGYKLIYIYKANGGQADALNHGLKVFTGDFLTWPDSDDFISNDSIEKKVEFLEANKEYGMVRTSAYMYNEDNLECPIGFLGKEKKPIEKIFDGLILESVGCTPGRYMVTKEAFLTSNMNRKIYNSRSGQNWQMLLPIAYQNKCGYIDEELFSYVIRKDSHSHCDEGISKEVSLNKLLGHEDILVNTVNKVIRNDKEKEYYLNIISEKYARRRVSVAKLYGDYDLANRNKDVLKSLGKLTLRDRVVCLSIKYRFLNNSLVLIKKLFNRK